MPGRRGSPHSEAGGSAGWLPTSIPCWCLLQKNVNIEKKKKREKKKIGFCRKCDRGTSGITCELQLWCYLRRRSHTSNPCSVSGSFKHKEAGTFWGFYRPRGRGWRWHHTFDSTSKEGRKGLQSASHHLQSLRKQNNHSTTFSFCLVVQPQKAHQTTTPQFRVNAMYTKPPKWGEKKGTFPSLRSSVKGVWAGQSWLGNQG